MRPLPLALLMGGLLLTGCSEPTAPEVSTAQATAPLPAQPPPVPAVQSVAASAELVAVATGAVVDESTIGLTIRVDPADPAARPNILAGLQVALGSLAKGVPTRVLIAPGTYRDDASMLRFDAPVVRDTLLVIEAAPGGAVCWSGADQLAEISWTDEGAGLWSTAWTAGFGNFTYPWGEPKGVGPRREMVFNGDQALRPVALETYAIEGHNQFPKPGEKVIWKPLEHRDPATALTVGQFGVSDERRRMWVRLAPGAKPAAIEAAVRPVLLDLSGKSRVVLRGITFTRCANGHQDLYSQAPVRVGLDPAQACGDILIDHCRFVWNSTLGLAVRGWRWTLKDSQFDYNGNSGISVDGARDVVFDGCSTSFNCWREFLAGVEDWCFGGFKVHRVEGHLVRNHTAIGNADHGMWWDVWCKDVVVDGATLVYNRRSLIYELSFGPFYGRRILAVGGYRPAKRDEHGQPKADLDPVVCFSCSERAVLESSVIWSDAAPHLFGASWYERDNDHARLNTSQPGLHELRRSVVVGGAQATILVGEDNVGDRQAPGWRSFLYRGTGNLFWRPGEAAACFRYADAQWQRHAIPLAAWQQLRTETDARWADPQFRDPAHGDFRVSEGSPLHGRGDLPLIKIDPQQLAAAQVYFTWLGWPNLPQP